MEEPNSEIRFETLFRQAISGDDQDRAILLELFRNYLRQIAAGSMTPDVGGKLSVSDLVQSAIIEANRDFKTCQATNQAEFKAWIRKILMNDMLNRYRDLRRQKRDIRREQLMGSKLEIVDEVTGGPVNEVIRQEDEKRLMSALAQLPPDRRELIELRNRDGLSFAEIAERQQKSPDAVRMNWNRAIESLSKIIGYRSSDD